MARNLTLWKSIMLHPIPSLSSSQAIAVALMSVLVVTSNLLVEVPINQWLTYGALTYPFTYLITELVNRFQGQKEAKKVVYYGFAIAIVISFTTSPYRIAIASTTAFLISQLLDIAIFARLRAKTWWVAPIAASSLATSVDTLIFFSISFAGTDYPWITIGFGDWLIKFAIDIVALVPFRAALGLFANSSRSNAKLSY